jgi:hypothetical protein
MKTKCPICAKWINEKNATRGYYEITNKLTACQVLEIRDKAANGISRKELSKEYNVSVSSIGLIITRKTWFDI